MTVGIFILIVIALPLTWLCVIRPYVRVLLIGWDEIDTFDSIMVISMTINITIMVGYGLFYLIDIYWKTPML